MTLGDRNVLLCLAACGAACARGNGNDVSQDAATFQSDGMFTGGNPGPEPDPWNAPGMEDTELFAWGVQTGDATSSSVLVSARSLALSGLSLRVMEGTNQGWTQQQLLEALPVQDGVTQVEVTGLKPDTTYSVIFESGSGSTHVRSPVARFRTALADNQLRVVRFGATGSLGGNEPWDSLSNVASEKLDVFLLLGDTIYADEEPHAGQFVEKWKDALQVDGLRRLGLSTSFAATWDDQELDKLWSWNTPNIQVRFDAALAAFRQAIPQRRGPAGSAVWRKLKWGNTLELFILDSRSERSDKESGIYISSTQLNWLKQGLAESTARFKIVAQSIPILDFSKTAIGALGADDRWQGFTTQRFELLQWIRTKSIKGVLWVSGDVHFGAIGFVDPKNGVGDDQVEVIAGPAGSPINPGAPLLKTDDQMLLFVKTWNRALFEADPVKGTVTVTFVDDEDKVVGTRKIQL